MAVHARLYSNVRDEKTLVAEATFSDYNATHIRNPDRSPTATYWVPTGTYGWQEWAKPLLGERHGVVQTSGPRGVSYVTIP